MMKILVPTDFSSTAEKALMFAIDFATTGASVVLHHSYTPIESGFYSASRKEEQNRDTENEIAAQLKTLVKHAEAKRGDISISTVIDRGVGERCIINAAQKAEADWIIMGTTGASGLKEKLIGSVTAEVMNRAPCPVIGVPHHYEPRPIRNIAFASDFMLEDIDAIKLLCSIAERFKSHIIITHFDKGDRTSRQTESLMENYKKMVSQAASYPGISFDMQRVDNIVNAMKDLSQRSDMDLLAMITHRRKGFFQNLFDKSFTKQISYSSRIPLLSIPIQPEFTGN